MSSPGRSVASVLAAGVLFGTAGTAQALGPSATTPLGVGAIRLLVGALALLVAMPLLGGRPGRIPALWRTRAGLLSALGASLYQVCFFVAVQQVGVALGTLVAAGSAPIFAGLLSRVALGHRPTLAWLAATLLCVVGLSLRSNGHFEGANLLGLALALAAGLCSAAYNVGAREQMDRGAAGIEVPAAAFSLGSLAMLPVLASQPLGWLGTPMGLGLALYLGLATMALANLVLSAGLRGLSPGPVTTLMLGDPLVATALGVLVLGERLDLVAAAGLVLVFAGLALQGVVLSREPDVEPEVLPVL